jgi:hypothetical protein
MKVQPIPKPKFAKIRKKKNPPLFQLGYCWGCLEKYGEYNYRNMERHHICSGNPDRQLSELYGLYVDMCNKHHDDMTNEKDRGLKMKLYQEGQRRLDAVHGEGKFMELFKRNYL